MKCAELMSVDLRLLPADANVQEAALLMRDNSVGFLPVCNDRGRVIGVLTDRDIAVRAASTDRLPSVIPVAEVMTQPPVLCGDHEDLVEIERRMVEHGVARLVVVDGAGVPVGIISLTDLLQREPRWRAVQVARGVLSREAQGPHFPVDRIQLTPGVPLENNVEDNDGIERGSSFESVIVGGSATRSMKEFPR